MKRITKYKKMFPNILTIDHIKQNTTLTLGATEPEKKSMSEMIWICQLKKYG